MLKQFFTLFGGLLAFVLIVGALFIKLFSSQNLVEYWILLMLPAFAVPILTSALISKTEPTD